MKFIGHYFPLKRKINEIYMITKKCRAFFLKSFLIPTLSCGNSDRLDACEYALRTSGTGGSGVRSCCSAGSDSDSGEGGDTLSLHIARDWGGADTVFTARLIGHLLLTPDVLLPLMLVHLVHLVHLRLLPHAVHRFTFFTPTFF